MATYRLKRKTYGVADAAGNVLGGTAEGVGKALDSKPAALAGGIIGAKALGSTIGSLIGLGPVGTVLGGLVGAGIGSAATRGLGKGLKSAGEDAQTNG